MQDGVISYDVTRWSMAMFTASVFLVFIFIIILQQIN